MPKTILVVCLFIAGAAREAMAQDGAKREHRFIVGWSVESWEADLDITGSSNNFGDPASDLEQGIDARVAHSIFLLSGNYEYVGMENFLIRAHLGLGQERMNTIFEIPSTNPSLGDGDGDFDLDTAYDGGFVWEFGAGVRYAPGDQKYDVGLSLSYRAGDSDRSDGLTDENYEYTRLTVAIEGGWRATENVRPFLALRFVTYEAEYDISEKLPSGTDTFSFDLELDASFGVTLGVDLTGGPVTGQVGLLLLDSAGFFASVGWKF